MTLDPLPEVVSSRRVHLGFIGVRVDTLSFGTGRESTAEVVEHVGGVTIIAFNPEGHLLLVSQYRHPCGRYLLELPAGTLNAGESPEACAERELQEETGYRPGHLERLGGFYLAPGYCSEYQHVFLASDLAESRLEAEEETLRLEPLPLEDVLAAAAGGRIEDAKTLAALLLYVRR